MKKSISVVLFIFLTTSIALAAPKTIDIGKTTFLTEQNTFSKIIKTASDSNKMIFVVFSASWCMPCQAVKKTVFHTDEFAQLTTKIVPVYIEETTKKGKQYVEDHTIKVFPTFKIFSPEGIELDTFRDYENQTVQGFRDWIDDVEKGKNLYTIRKKTEQDPENRDLWFELSTMLDAYDYEKKIETYRKIIDLKPDLDDPTTHEVYEKLTLTILNYLSRLKGETLEKKRQELDPDMMRVFEGYFPDTFNHDLKGSSGYVAFMTWFMLDQNYDKTKTCFQEFLQSDHNIRTSIDVYNAALMVALETNDLRNASQIIDYIESATSLNPELWQDQDFLYDYFKSFPGVVNKMLKNDHKALSTQFATSMYHKMNNIDAATKESLGPYFDHLVIQVAENSDLLHTEALTIIDNQLKEETGLDYILTSLNKAKILFRQGKREEAKVMALKLSQGKPISNLSKKEQSGALNSIAWTLYELGLVDQQVINLAEKSVKLSKNANNLDTLACVYAATGDFTKAVKTQKKAIALISRESKKQPFQEKIALWQQGKKEQEITEDEIDPYFLVLIPPF